MSQIHIPPDFFKDDVNLGAAQADMSARGVHVLRPGCGAIYHAPAWEGKCTVIRMLPYFWRDHSGQLQEVPCRDGTPKHFLSPWVRTYPAFRGIGLHSRATFLVNDPQKNPSFNKEACPGMVLYREIINAVANASKANGQLPSGRTLANGSTYMPPYWNTLVDTKAPGKSPPIRAISSVAYVLALVYRHLDKWLDMNAIIGLRQDDGPVLFEIPGSLWTQRLMPMLRQLKEGYRGALADWENAYVCGDPVGMKAGRYLHIFEKGRDPRGSAAVSSAAGYGQGPSTGPAGGNDRFGGELKGYDCFFTRTRTDKTEDNDLPAALDIPSARWVSDKVKSYYQPIENLVSVKTEEEQARILSDLYPPEVLIYAWHNHPQWISDDLREKAKANLNLAGMAGVPVAGFTPTPGFVGGSPYAAVMPATGMPSPAGVYVPAPSTQFGYGPPPGTPGVMTPGTVPILPPPNLPPPPAGYPAAPGAPGVGPGAAFPAPAGPTLQTDPAVPGPSTPPPGQPTAAPAPVPGATPNSLAALKQIRQGAPA